MKIRINTKNILPKTIWSFIEEQYFGEKILFINCEKDRHIETIKGFGGFIQKTIRDKERHIVFVENIDSLPEFTQKTIFRRILELESDMILTYENIKMVTQVIISRTIPVTSLEQLSKLGKTYSCFDCYGTVWLVDETYRCQECGREHSQWEVEYQEKWKRGDFHDYCQVEKKGGTG